MKNNRGQKDKATKESRTSLAAYLRSVFPKELMAEYYKVALMGKSPVMIELPEDEECHPYCKCGFRFVGKEGGYANPNGPTLDHTLLIWARLSERQYGMAAQHTVIEQEIQATLTTIVGVDTDYVNQLSPAALMAIKSALQGKALPEAQEDVVDAEFTEVKDDEE